MQGKSNRFSRTVESASGGYFDEFVLYGFKRKLIVKCAVQTVRIFAVDGQRNHALLVAAVVAVPTTNYPRRLGDVGQPDTRESIFVCPELRERIANFAASGTHCAGSRGGRSVRGCASDVKISPFTLWPPPGRPNVEMHCVHSSTPLTQ